MAYCHTSTFWNLVQAIRSGQVVAFVGAGVSRAVKGTPTWDKAVAELIRALRRTINARSVRFKEILDALEESAAGDLLFAAEQCRKYLQEEFPDQVKSIMSVEGQEDEVAQRGLEVFMKLPFYRIVTTNYDNLLLDVGRKCQPDKNIEIFTHRDTVCFGEFLRNGDSDSRRIFHLHGHFGDPESVVLTEGQYQENYSKPEFRQLMESLFATKSALFIGFSLSDLDVMQIFRRIIAQFPRSRESHFAILPRTPDKSACSLWLESLRYNYKYSVGILNYDCENGSHRGLWKLVEDLAQELGQQRPTKPTGKIAIIIDEGFPYRHNLYDNVAFLNGIQTEIRYSLCTDIHIDLPKRFKGADRTTRDAAFEPIIEFHRRNTGKFDGYFAITNKQEAMNYFFCDRRFGGFISTWFWSEHVGRRPSIDEFISHTLVLLTLHFYDQRINRTQAGGSKVLQTHKPDIGCLFDFTQFLRDRIAVIDYPCICPKSRQQLDKAFAGSEIALGIDWLRKVMPLAE